MGVSNKGTSGESVVVSTGPLAMGAYYVVTVRVVMTEGPLARGAYEVLGSVVAAAVGYFLLRSGVRFSGAAGEEIWLVGVYGSP